LLELEANRSCHMINASCSEAHGLMSKLILSLNSKTKKSFSQQKKKKKEQTNKQTNKKRREKERFWVVPVVCRVG
jgi:hypothetical protein